MRNRNVSIDPYATELVNQLAIAWVRRDVCWGTQDGELWDWHAQHCMEAISELIQDRRISIEDTNRYFNIITAERTTV